MSDTAVPIRDHERGEVLFREGENGDRMFVLRSGRVRISKAVDGKARTLAMLGPGDFFGEMAILTGKPRTATAEVEEDASMLEIDADRLQQMLTENAEIALRLVKKLAQRLGQANAWIDILMHRDPGMRTVLGIAQMAEVEGEVQEGGKVQTRLEVAAVASQLGLREDEVARVVRRLGRLGLLQELEEGFAVPDVLKIHEFVSFMNLRD